MCANPVVGVARAALRRPPTRQTRHADMPLVDARTPLPEIAAVARRHMPGAVIRRHLFFRYSLVWRRPGSR
jgi:hypothetical protein